MQAQDDNLSGRLRREGITSMLSRDKSTQLLNELVKLVWTLDTTLIQRTDDNVTVCLVMCITTAGTAADKCRTAIKALIKCVQTMEISMLPKVPGHNEVVRSQMTG